MEVPPETYRAVSRYKLCNVASCWIYEYIGILLGAHSILHISRIRVNTISSYEYSWQRKISFKLRTTCTQNPKTTGSPETHTNSEQDVGKK